MYGKMVNKTVEKPNKVKNNKRGFTLVELAIVMGILVIVTGITVSFSVLMRDLTADNRDEYAFLEDHSEFKEEFGSLIAENDVSGSEFTVKNGDLLIGEKTVKFSGGTLLVINGNQVEKRVAGFDKIDSVTFKVVEGKNENKLIKCTTQHTNEDGVPVKISFVISLRCGEILTTEGGGV